MFVTTLVFSKLVTWMRGQSGTSDLRALVYMDEVAGYVPPTAAPPAKKPILTIFKQGRAFGLGLVLSTQNPVDLDYKAMANAGTWLVGRLQTENDKARVLEGLRSAAGGADIDALDASIGALAEAPVHARLCERRAATGLRHALGDVVPARAADEGGGGAVDECRSTPCRGARRDRYRRTAAPLAADETSVAPAAASGVTVSYLDPAAPWAAQVGADRRGGEPARIRRDACLAPLRRHGGRDRRGAGVRGAVRPSGRRLRSRLPRRSSTSTTVTSGPMHPPALRTCCPSAPVGESKFFSQAAKDVQARLVANRSLEIFRNRPLKLTSRPGETEEAFLARCDEAGQVKADEETVKLTKRLEAKKDRLENALALARRRVEELDTQTKSRQANEMITGAGAVLGALFGGKRSARSITNAVGSVASKRGQTATLVGAERHGRGQGAATTDDLAELEQEILDEVSAIDEKWRAVAGEIEPVAIRLEATDVRVMDVRLVWVPVD